MVLKNPLFPKTKINPKIAEITGKIKGIPSKLIKYSFKKKFRLNNALEMGIARKQLIVEENIACLIVKVRVLTS